MMITKQDIEDAYGQETVVPVIVEAARDPPSLLQRWMGSLLPPSKYFFMIIIPALVLQTGFNFLWQEVLEPDGFSSPDPFILNMFIFVGALAVGLKWSGNLDAYKSARAQWDTSLTNITNIAFLVASAFREDSISGDRTLIFRAMVDIRDILIALPFAMKHYFRGKGGIMIGKLPINERLKGELRGRFILGEDGRLIGKVLDIMIFVLFSKYNQLSDAGILNAKETMQIKMLQNSIGDIETARTFGVLPVVKYHTRVAIGFLLIAISYYLFPLYRWNTLWIFPIFAYLFVGFLLAGTLATNPFKDPEDNKTFVTMQYREESNQVGGAVYIAFRDDVLSQFSETDETRFKTANDDDLSPLVGVEMNSFGRQTRRRNQDRVIVHSSAAMAYGKRA